MVVIDIDTRVLVTVTVVAFTALVPVVAVAVAVVLVAVWAVAMIAGWRIVKNVRSSAIDIHALAILDPVHKHRDG